MEIETKQSLIICYSFRANITIQGVISYSSSSAT